jgi:uncharacterized protein (TIGR01244 family)
MDDRVKISDKITSGRQPTAEEIKKLPQQGFKTVINLRTAGEEDQPLSPLEEGNLVKDQGQTYVNIPVSSQEGPKPQQVDRFRQEVERLPSPIFVHCRRGKRSGALSLIHVALKEGLSGKEAFEKAESLGYECDVPKLKEFFKNYINEHQQTA